MKKCSICGCEVNDNLHIVLNAEINSKKKIQMQSGRNFRKQIRIIRMDFIMMTV